MISLKLQSVAEHRPVAAETAATTPLYFGPTDRPLFGWFHTAKNELQRDTAVVLCSPIGYEALCTHDSYRYLAEQLADSGIAALRFDYDGRGDSFGSDDDPDCVEHWLASIDHAVEYARARSGARHVVLFGVRLGATCAVAASARRDDIDGLVLWGSCRSGRSYLREMRVLFASANDQNGETGAEAEYEEAAGFAFNRDTVEELGGLDAAVIAHTSAKQVLLIERDDLPTDKKIAGQLTKLGADITPANWPGYAEMMRDPQETKIPQDAIASIKDWLIRHSEPMRLRHLTAYPAASDSRDRMATTNYSEEPWIDAAGDQTFAMITRPARQTERTKTAVLLLNVGANYHIGPSRMYVTLARQLAADGFLAVRIDSPEIGDSASGLSNAREQIYSRESIEHVLRMMDRLQAEQGITQFALVGLCSGAYTAYRASIDDARINMQVMINVQTFDWRDGDSLEMFTHRNYKPTHVYLGNLRSANTLRRIVKRQVDVRGIARALAGRVAAKAAMTAKSTLAKTLRIEHFDSPVCRTFRRIADRGTKTLMIFAADDVGVDLAALHLGREGGKLRRPGQFEMAYIAGADHTFTKKRQRDQLLALIGDRLRKQYPNNGSIVRDC